MNIPGGKIIQLKIQAEKYILVLLAILLLIIFSSNTVLAHPPSDMTRQTTDNGPDPEPSDECENQTFDGLIANDEYEFVAELNDGDFEIHWRIQGDRFYMAVKARTTGWIAIGFEPTTRMEDADMIIGWVDDNGEHTVLDCFSEGEYGPHPPDKNIGGTCDLLGCGGAEASGWTTLEFSRYLDTGDYRDKIIDEDSELYVIWAVGDNDDYTSSHSDRGAARINLKTGEAEEIEIPEIWPFHSLPMLLGFFLMLAGIIIAKTMKEKDWWFKAHKTLNTIGSILAIVGLVIAVYMVNEAGSGHFRVPHAILGGITISLLILTPILGFALMKGTESTEKLRPVHRWVGRIAIALMLIVMFTGYSLVGVI